MLPFPPNLPFLEILLCSYLPQGLTTQLNYGNSEAWGSSCTTSE